MSEEYGVRANRYDRQWIERLAPETRDYISGVRGRMVRLVQGTPNRKDSYRNFQKRVFLLCEYGKRRASGDGNEYLDLKGLKPDDESAVDELEVPDVLLRQVPSLFTRDYLDWSESFASRLEEQKATAGVEQGLETEPETSVEEELCKDLGDPRQVAASLVRHRLESLAKNIVCDVKAHHADDFSSVMSEWSRQSPAVEDGESPDLQTAREAVKTLLSGTTVMPDKKYITKVDPDEFIALVTNLVREHLGLDAGQEVAAERHDYLDAALRLWISYADGRYQTEGDRADESAFSVPLSFIRGNLPLRPSAAETWVVRYAASLALADREIAESSQKWVQMIVAALKSVVRIKRESRQLGSSSVWGPLDSDPDEVAEILTKAWRNLAYSKVNDYVRQTEGDPCESLDHDQCSSSLLVVGANAFDALTRKVLHSYDDAMSRAVSIDEDEDKNEADQWAVSDIFGKAQTTSQRINGKPLFHPNAQDEPAGFQKEYRPRDIRREYAIMRGEKRLCLEYRMIFAWLNDESECENKHKSFFVKDARRMVAVLRGMVGLYGEVDGLLHKDVDRAIDLCLDEADQCRQAERADEAKDWSRAARKLDEYAARRLEDHPEEGSADVLNESFGLIVKGWMGARVIRPLVDEHWFATPTAADQAVRRARNKIRTMLYMLEGLGNICTFPELAGVRRRMEADGDDYQDRFDKLLGFEMRALERSEGVDVSRIREEDDNHRLARCIDCRIGVLDKGRSASVLVDRATRTLIGLLWDYTGDSRLVCHGGSLGSGGRTWCLDVHELNGYQRTHERNSHGSVFAGELKQKQQRQAFVRIREVARRNATLDDSPFAREIESAADIGDSLPIDGLQDGALELWDTETLHVCEHIVATELHSYEMTRWNKAADRIRHALATEPDVAKKAKAALHMVENIAHNIEKLHPACLGTSMKVICGMRPDDVSALIEKSRKVSGK